MRTWIFREELTYAFSNANQIIGLGVHALNRDRWMNLNEIMEEHRKFYDDWPDDSTQKNITEEQILKDLELLEQSDYIKSKST